jgi:hypothetical protein
MMALGQYLLTIVESLDGLKGPCFVIGFAFGFVFGVLPAIIADTFGTDEFNTVWGLGARSGFLVLIQLSKILAEMLKKNSDEDGVCTLGALATEIPSSLPNMCALVLLFLQFSLSGITAESINP